MHHATKDSYPLILARSFALIALFAVPLSTAGVNIAATLFAVCALLSPEVWRNWRSLFTDRVSVAALLLAAVLTLSLAWTTADRVHAMDFLMKYRKLIYLPLLILTFRDCRTTAWTTAAKWALFSALTFLLLLSCSNYFGWTSIGPWHSNTDPIRRAWVFKDHIAAGIMMALLFYLALNFAKQARTRAAKAALCVVALLAIVNVLLMMQGRTGQIIAILFIVVYVVTYFVSLRGVKPWVRWGAASCWWLSRAVSCTRRCIRTVRVSRKRTTKSAHTKRPTRTRQWACGSCSIGAASNCWPSARSSAMAWAPCRTSSTRTHATTRAPPRPRRAIRTMNFC
ncbi:hypothetical protein PPGU16_22720 [Paraburkholderia largidicola]|uniref:O-antigen polymerase n=1 Tax=Paraburkholderia largidicola TaxID=3014751 RepID=A0A7I8BL12_9BURK|nr:hypothetical protein PPGU16_22720 [Paraburkholderia sp. PGU16]